MISIVTWLWNDPLMTGGQRVIGYKQPELRIDMQQQVARRARREAVKLRHALQRAAREPIYAHQPARHFKPEHVVRLAALFKKHLTIPHRFVCVTDEPPSREEALLKYPGVEWITTPAAAAELGALRSPEGPKFPSCYRRLWSFSREARALLGERILVTDIDAVPVGNLDHIFKRHEPFVGWRPYRDWGRKLRIGGGIYLMDTGAHPKVYEEFAAGPHAAIRAAAAAGFRGSDQAWLSYKLAAHVPLFSRADGLYSIRDFGHNGVPPKDAKLIQCNGPAHCKPWSTPIPWLRTAWNAV